MKWSRGGFSWVIYSGRRHYLRLFPTWLHPGPRSVHAVSVRNIKSSICLLFHPNIPEHPMGSALDIPERPVDCTMIEKKQVGHHDQMLPLVHYSTVGGTYHILCMTM